MRKALGRMRGRYGQAGFTLVEVIVATSIGAIVLGAVTSIVLTTVISTNVATSRIDATTQVRDFQLNAYDDFERSAMPAVSGCGTSASPCTSQPIVLIGSRMPNQVGVAPSPYTVTYTWDPTLMVVTRQVTGGTSRPVATGVTSYSWYLDSTAPADHPTVVVNITVTARTFNASYSESQSFRFYPRVGA